jgi:hypothetical protein
MAVTPKKNVKLDKERTAAAALEAQLRVLCSEDDFAHGLTVLDDYPEMRTRSLSLFEEDLRDWGFVYGLAFGLAISANPQMAHEDTAKLAYIPARDVNAKWGGEIEDPGEKRESAIRALVKRFKDSDDAGELRDAVIDLVESARA